MKAPKFKPHYNAELGKKYYSAKDYYSDIKKAGLEPYNPASVVRKPDAPYVQSDWGRQMKQDIVDRKGRPPGDRFIKELEKRGYTQQRADEARRMANGR